MFKVGDKAKIIVNRYRGVYRQKGKIVTIFKVNNDSYYLYTVTLTNNETWQFHEKELESLTKLDKVL